MLDLRIRKLYKNSLSQLSHITRLSSLLLLLHLTTCFQTKLHFSPPAFLFYYLFFLFSNIFPLFHQTGWALFCAPRRFSRNRSGQFVHAMKDIKPDSDSSFLILTRDKFTALQDLAEKALLRTEATAQLTYSAEDEEKLNSDVTTQTRLIRSTPPVTLTTFTPTQPLSFAITQLSSTSVSPQVLYYTVYMYIKFHTF